MDGSNVYINESIFKFQSFLVLPSLCFSALVVRMFPATWIERLQKQRQRRANQRTSPTHSPLLPPTIPGHAGGQGYEPTTTPLASVSHCSNVLTLCSRHKRLALKIRGVRAHLCLRQSEEGGGFPVRDLHSIAAFLY